MVVSGVDIERILCSQKCLIILFFKSCDQRGKINYCVISDIYLFYKFIFITNNPAPVVAPNTEADLGGGCRGCATAPPP